MSESIIDPSSWATICAKLLVAPDDSPTSIKSVAQDIDREAIQPAVREATEELMKALKPFAALLHKHHDSAPNAAPVFGINGATITVGDLRMAHALLAKYERTTPNETKTD